MYSVWSSIVEKSPAITTATMMTQVISSTLADMPPCMWPIATSRTILTGTRGTPLHPVAGGVLRRQEHG